jgi:hypothetical protein
MLASTLEQSVLRDLLLLFAMTEPLAVAEEPVRVVMVLLLAVLFVEVETAVPVPLPMIPSVFDVDVDVDVGVEVVVVGSVTVGRTFVIVDRIVFPAASTVVMVLSTVTNPSCRLCSP